MTLEGSRNEEVSFVGDYWSLPTDIDLLASAGDAFVQKLIDAGWQHDSDEVYWFRMAFDEAFINAVVHGNLGFVKPKDSEESSMTVVRREQLEHPTDRRVYVDIDVTPNRVSLTIRDEGAGFNWREVSDPTVGDAVMKTSGRGLFFMRSFFDDISYNEIGNEVRIVKSKKPAETI
ncbi:MAG TPA: ATP-binding protein [Candidatus Paceibacterota bacterium]